MLLSRILLNPRNRLVYRDLADCADMHRRVLSMFPEVEGRDTGARAALGVLYREEWHDATGLPQMLIQSKEAPCWDRLPAGFLADECGEVENPASKPVDGVYAQIAQGMELAFRLVANPTKKVPSLDATGIPRKNGKRVELRGEEELTRWLARKATGCGFVLVDVRARPGVFDVLATEGGKFCGQRGTGGRGADSTRLTFSAVRFDGRLRVVDQGQFVRALAAGVGSAKGYGFGLLTVAPVPR